MANPFDQFDTQTAKANPFDQFDSTPGGAAVGNPNIQRVADRAIKQSANNFSLSTIAGAGATGAALGYFAAPIMESAAPALAGLPVVGPALSTGATALGRMARVAGPVAGALSGGVSGLAGESAGQLAESSGASAPVAEAARFIGGAVTPEFKTAAGAILKAATFGKGGLAVDALRGAVNKLAGREGKLTDDQRLYVDQAIAELHGTRKPGEPLDVIGGALRTGGTAARSAGYDAAYKILDDTERAARMEVDAAIKGPVAERKKAAAYLESLKGNASERSRAALSTIGDDRELGEIGADLRAIAVSRKDTIRNAASEAFENSRNEVAKVVASKEANPNVALRQYINNTPGYKALVGSLERELAPGKHSPDVASNYRKILSEITNPEKDVFGQSKPVSFQQIDDVRRMLGEAFRGQPAEGYSSIGEVAAKEYYQKLRDIQQQFGGAKVGKMLSDYADSKQGLEVFGSRVGKKLTALDRYDDAQFATDTTAIPKAFFANAEQFRNLVELTGNKDVAVKAARDYVTNQLKGMETSKQVGDWMLRNRDFLNGVPEVHFSVADYKNVLDKSERVIRGLDAGAKKLDEAAKNVLSSANERASGIRVGGQLQSKAEIERADLVGKLFGKFSDAKTARDLIESGDLKKWELAAPILEKSPDAKRAVYSALGQIMSDAPKAGATKNFSEVIRPALEKFNMIGKTEADQIAKQLAQLEAGGMPAKEILGWQKRILAQAMTGYAGTIFSRKADKPEPFITFDGVPR